jgi:hypothetical protein
VTRHLVAVLLSLALLWGPLAPSALAEDRVPVRKVTVRWKGRAPRLSFSARDFVDAGVEKKLKSGLPQRIVTRVYAYSSGGGDKPLAVAATACRVVYDLWEGVYRVQLSTPERDRSLNATSLKQVTAACLDVEALALGEAAGYARHGGRPVYFAGLIELNPLARDTLNRIRRWLSRSGGGNLDGDAFFGSFVSTFVARRLGSAERTMSFRSKVFTVPR